METVLIIEDDSTMLRGLEDNFTFAGYNVITAADGEAGLDAGLDANPDLIILDRVLGDMAGEEVAAKLKEYPKTKDIPVIFVSALFSKMDEIDKEHSFCGSLMFAKPYDTGKLMTAIKKFL